MIWIIFLILLALFFDYLNGFHDAANAVSTVISTRVLSPKFAVAWAAFFNFAAFLIFKTAVAKTIGAGIVDINVVDSTLIFGALMGACGWNLITWWLGLPSSSSHALIGGLMGAGIVKADANVRKWLGFTLLPQAGVAVGMAQIALTRLPGDAGAKVQAVVLCATLIYEIVGPVLTKMALSKAGEIDKKA